jgi:hypothetical protein
VEGCITFPPKARWYVRNTWAVYSVYSGIKKMQQKEQKKIDEERKKFEKERDELEKKGWIGKKYFIEK